MQLIGCIEKNGVMKKTQKFLENVATRIFTVIIMNSL
ncbi:UNVERIFIED_CONTAM: hypothetical protein GTU68_065238 [Idotea baltica]|nr:hypothetical protein [Idotea baltica]